MFDRRTFLRTGFSGALLGALARSGHGLARFGVKPGQWGVGSPPASSDPVLSLPFQPPSLTIDGLPFAKWFSGDSFTNREIPFHGAPPCDPLPEVTEESDIVVVGGGISGLATAYLLREHQPIVLEMHKRFGGAAQGERWGGTTYSLGNAYVITPDAGSFLANIYDELGLPEVVRVDDQDAHVELNDVVLDDFFDPRTHSPEEQRAFERYREVVLGMANVNYPDIPLPAGRDNQWILDLDQKTLRQDIEDQMGMPIPATLAAAIQAYCYSSFASGWEEISAASGWNFLAAEEFGRWVFPGGNSYMAQALWAKLKQAETPPFGPQRRMLRAGARAVDVRLTEDERVRVTYFDETGTCHGILAKKVVMSNPKFVATTMINDLAALDEDKASAIESLRYRAYVVVNVLLDAPIVRDFYDIFLLEDGSFPMSEAEAQAGSRVTDVLNGQFARRVDEPRSVLTLYWPLPFDFGRWTLLINDGYKDYACALVPQIKRMLELLDVGMAHVRQVRMTRWGHALPIAEPGLIASGVTAALQRPIQDKIFFVQQDNWALPAVENCLLDAEIYAPQISAGL